MDINRLTRDADDLIRKVVSRYNQLYVPAGQISQLELDLILEDLRKLYDTFKTLGQESLNLQNNPVKPEVQVKTEVPSHHHPQPASGPTYAEKHPQSPEPEAKIHETHVVNLYAPKPEPEIVAEEIPEVNSEPEFISEPEFEPEQKPETDKPIMSGIPVAEESAPVAKEIYTPSPNPELIRGTLADKFNTGNKSLSETLASAPANGMMGSRVQYQPITDLSSGIGLNDKFSFISELFGNDTALYEEALSRVNKAVNIDEANWILQKYHTPEWENRQETIARLKDFLRRRFI
ncbi:MAG: hypothetical protein WCR72_14320 [Bacteroidota bacterium]